MREASRLEERKRLLHFGWWEYLALAFFVVATLSLSVILYYSGNAESVDERQLVHNEKFGEDLIDISDELQQDLIDISDELQQDLLKMKPLPCTKPLLESLEQYKNKISQETYDMVRMVISEMNLLQQRLHLVKPIQAEEGFYFRDDKTLKDKFKRLDRCDIESPNNLRVAVCTMQRETGPYIQEFISHYLLLGASKVIIYDNSKPDTLGWSYFRKVVEPFVLAGYVEVHDWYFDSEGMDGFNPIPAFDKCSRDQKSNGFDWVVSVDTDEFVVIQSPHDPCLNRLMKNFDQYGALVMHWRLMSPLGTNPQRDPTKLFLDQFRFQVPDPLGRVKNIFQTKYLTSVVTQHRGAFSDGRYAATFSGQRCDGDIMSIADADKWGDIELRHFFGRDWTFYFYEKLCSTSLVSWVTNFFFQGRVEIFFEALVTKDEIDTNTQHSELLRKFLFEE